MDKTRKRLETHCNWSVATATMATTLSTSIVWDNLCLETAINLVWYLKKVDTYSHWLGVTGVMKMNTNCSATKTWTSRSTLKNTMLVAVQAVPLSDEEEKRRFMIRIWWTKEQDGPRMKNPWRVYFKVKPPPYNIW